MLLGHASALCAATAEFRTLGLDAEIAGLHYASGGRDIALTVTGSVLSDPFTLPGAGPLELYRIETREGQPVRVPVLSLPVPPGVTRALLLLHQGADGVCSGRWLDDSPGHTPAGTLRVHNFSSHDLAVSLGGAEPRLLERGAQLHQGLPAAARSLPVRVALRRGDGWEYALGISQPVRARFRFVILVRDARPSIEEPEASGPLHWLALYETPADEST